MGTRAAERRIVFLEKCLVATTKGLFTVLDVAHSLYGRSFPYIR